MTPNTNLNVKVTYRLSADGQRAALLAGRPAGSTVCEMMPLTDTAMIAALSIASDGSLSLDASPYPNWDVRQALYFDVPPAGLSEVVEAYRAHQSANQARAAEIATEHARKQTEQALAAQQAIERDAPAVAAILAELEALDPAAELPAGVKVDHWNIYARDGVTQLQYTREDIERMRAVRSRREKVVNDAVAAEKAAKLAAREAVIAQHGGMWWAPAMTCEFTGYGLWNSGQSKRWVGIFTALKGIATFCDSPRGEFAFDTRKLEKGDCVQGGGYDTNSRGKRRNESEWFGVVVRNDDTGLVIRQCGSRAAAFAFAKKMQ